MDIHRYEINCSNPAEELHDLQIDSYERNNLATNPDYSERQQQLKRQITDWMEQQNDSRTVFNRTYPVSGPKPTAETVACKQ